MLRAGITALLCATLGALLPAPAAGQAAVPTVKGYVISRSEHVLTIADARETKVRVVLGPHTRVGGRRSSAAAIAVSDLIRADGIAAADGSLEAFYVEVVLTGDAAAFSRRRPGISNVLLNWLLNGGLAIPLK